MKTNLKLKIRKHLIVVLFAVLVIIFAVLQGLYDWHLHREDNNNLASQPIIISLVNNAINNVDVSAPVEAQTGQVYFPDARLMLPSPGENLSLRQIEYANTTSTSAPLDMQVTTKSILNEAENNLLTAQANALGAHKDTQAELLAIFRQVPNLQACARGVQLFYSQQHEERSDYRLQFTKKLSNGKTLYAYTETACTSSQLPALVNYLKQIESY